jgi:3-hydroxyacyl-CoA dehydrogenase
LKPHLQMTQDISTIAVVGAGVMGNGIAQVIASADIDVMLADVDQRALERASERIDRSLRRQVAAGAITEAAAAAALERIEMTSDLESAGAAADHVVETVVCRRDTPGFITSRLIAILALEAARIVEEGIATPEDVNLACVKAFNHPMGPLDTVDFSGLDTTLKVADALTDQYGDRFRAPQNLRALVSAGHLGRKAGRGFRAYEHAS